MFNQLVRCILLCITFINFSFQTGRWVHNRKSYDTTLKVYDINWNLKDYTFSYKIGTFKVCLMNDNNFDYRVLEFKVNDDIIVDMNGNGYLRLNQDNIVIIFFQDERTPVIGRSRCIVKREYSINDLFTNEYLIENKNLLEHLNEIPYIEKNIPFFSNLGIDFGFGSNNTPSNRPEKGTWDLNFLKHFKDFHINYANQFYLKDLRSSSINNFMNQNVSEQTKYDLLSKYLNLEEYNNEDELPELYNDAFNILADIAINYGITNFFFNICFSSLSSNNLRQNENPTNIGSILDEDPGIFPINYILNLDENDVINNSETLLKKLKNYLVRFFNNISKENMNLTNSINDFENEIKEFENNHEINFYTFISSNSQNEDPFDLLMIEVIEFLKTDIMIKYPLIIFRNFIENISLLVNANFSKDDDFKWFKRALVFNGEILTLFKFDENEYDKDKQNQPVIPDLFKIYSQKLYSVSLDYQTTFNILI